MCQATKAIWHTPHQVICFRVQILLLISIRGGETMVYDYGSETKAQSSVEVSFITNTQE